MMYLFSDYSTQPPNRVQRNRERERKKDFFGVSEEVKVEEVCRSFEALWRKRGEKDVIGKPSVDATGREAAEE